MGTVKGFVVPEAATVQVTPAALVQRVLEVEFEPDLSSPEPSITPCIPCGETEETSALCQASGSSQTQAWMRQPQLQTSWLAEDDETLYTCAAFEHSGGRRPGRTLFPRLAAG